MENNDVKNDDVVSDVAVNDTSVLTESQEIAGLRKVHEFLKEFDRVPGSMSGAWSEMLDTIAVVANSLIAKITKNNSDDSVQENSSN